MQLNLKRPIIFFDLETTGLNITKDRIVEISVIKVYPDGHEEEKTRRLNPEMPIPEQASAVHGIHDEDVKDCPTFKQVSKSLAQMFEGCDIGGFNSNRFDIPLLAQEFFNAGIKFDFNKCKFIDVQTIFHKMEPRNLIAAYKFYCDKNLEDAHSACADTRATYEVLKAQLDRYSDDLQNDVEFLSNYSSQNRNVDLAAGRGGFQLWTAQGRERRASTHQDSTILRLDTEPRLCRGHQERAARNLHQDETAQ